MKRNLSSMRHILLAISLGIFAIISPTATSSSQRRKTPHKAAAVLEPKSGSTVSGKAYFEEKNGGVEVVIEIKGAKPGPHGLHLHETPDCAAANASSAGGHFNPDGTAHGAPDTDPHHAGDLGNITVAANGISKLKILLKGVTVTPGSHSVVGRALIVHAGPDDLKSQPSGNSGARVACGVVKATP